MDYKMNLAKKAVSLIKQDMVAGLGASSTMQYLVECLLTEIKNGLQVKLVTSSFVTQQLLIENGLTVHHISSFDAIDIYFDGCDQFNKNLHAVKSGGGIHTREKLLASMARQFVLLADQTKYVDQFSIQYPLVLEVLPEAWRYVQSAIKKHFTGARTEIRFSDKKIGPALTDNGNYLVDVWFTRWPDAAVINNTVKTITGVVETSLFYQLAQLALLPEGNDVIVVSRPES